MEPDVVMEQGDTCERCYFAHVIPVGIARALDDGSAAEASEPVEEPVVEVT